MRIISSKITRRVEGYMYDYFEAELEIETGLFFKKRSTVKAMKKYGRWEDPTTGTDLVIELRSACDAAKARFMADVDEAEAKERAKQK